MTTCVRCDIREVALRVSILQWAIAHADDEIVRLAIADVRRRLDRLIAELDFEAAA
jgi:hypothetical protein